MRIKLFEDFNQSTILDEVDMCLVDLRDKGFVWNCELPAALYISLYKVTSTVPFNGFKPDEIRDSIETMIEYFDEKYGVKEYSLTKPDSPGPGIKVDLNDRYNRTIYYLNIKINLGNEN
jgi:hypothetical protein